MYLYLQLEPTHDRQCHTHAQHSALKPVPLGRPSKQHYNTQRLSETHLDVEEGVSVQPGHVLIHFREEALQVAAVRIRALGVLPLLQRAAAGLSLQAQPAEHLAEDALRGAGVALRQRRHRHVISLFPHHRHGQVQEPT